VSTLRTVISSPMLDEMDCLLSCVWAESEGRRILAKPGVLRNLIPGQTQNSGSTEAHGGSKNRLTVYLELSERGRDKLQ
jgi:hypothetical protein